MKFFITILFLLFSTMRLFAGQSDLLPGPLSELSMVPESIRQLKAEIRQAEDAENWSRLAELRQELIEEWRQFNPEIAAYYRTAASAADTVADGLPETPQTPAVQQPTPLPAEVPEYAVPSGRWDQDVLVHQDRADDIAMDISREGNIYLAVLKKISGTDLVYIYRSTNGGSSWTHWSTVSASTRDFMQIELMCFDGYPGSSGSSYLLLFFRFDNGWMRVGRTLTSTPSWTYHTIVEKDVKDFAVDRNYPGSNYRAIVLFDSSNFIYSIRSEPSSYGTVWQDKTPLNILGKDLDLCYGRDGAVYATFNGYNTGNLYALENLNYGDPASWSNPQVLVQGSQYTTRDAEIIASRESVSSNLVSVVFCQQDGNTLNLKTCSKNGGSNWGNISLWVTNANYDFKFPRLYSYKQNGNRKFQGVFSKSGLNNITPRSILYKPYSNNWIISSTISNFTATGLQGAEIGDLDGNTAVIAYVGTGAWGVYFDNLTWPVPLEEPQTAAVATEFDLEQNYPNPFNPTTEIRYSVPETAPVSLTIYNSLGQEVRTLVNAVRQPGYYSITWNGRNNAGEAVGSGLYFYRLQAGNLSQMKKMILMR